MSSDDHEPLPEDAHDDDRGARNFFGLLHRYSNGGLVDNDEGLTTDPDFIEDALKQVTMYTRSHYDGIWQYLLEKDPAEGRARLLHQRVYVAKYMGESVFSWDDRETTEL